MSPAEVMPRYQMRKQEQNGAAEPPPQRGRPAVLLAPLPKTGQRYALPGERPPSRYSPGEDDGAIDRFDAWARAYRAGGVRRR